MPKAPPAAALGALKRGATQRHPDLRAFRAHLRNRTPGGQRRLLRWRLRRARGRGGGGGGAGWLKLLAAPCLFVFHL